MLTALPLILILIQVGARAQDVSRLVSKGAALPELYGDVLFTGYGQATSGNSSVAKYIDSRGGVTADGAVLYALAHNPEILAARKEVEAARALVKQASLRANPKLDTSVMKTVTGADNNMTLQGMLPLELGGRRSSRITVAEREVVVREGMLAARENNLAADVRAKFGQALAEASRLAFAEDLLGATERGYRLVAARVTEGKSAPLEQNMELVEVNRIRSQRELAEGKVEMALLELRNLMGMTPEEPLRLRDDFAGLNNPVVPVAEATEAALRGRPDLKIARANEALAEAQIEEARSSGRLDASLTGGYQRMQFGYPLRGIDERGRLAPISGTFHYLTFGVSLDLPVRNKNQGAIEAAVAMAEAAKRQREAAELTARREVAASYARYERAARSLQIFRAGVRGQAAENLGVVRQTYELGAKTLVDYIAEQRRYIEVESGYIDAALETYLARVETLRATASPDLTKRADQESGPEK